MNKKWLAAVLAAPLLTAGLVAVFPHALPSSPANEDSRTISRAERRAMIETLAERLGEHYVLADKAQNIASLLRERARQGDYDRIEDAPRLASALTGDLAAIAHDVNLQVAYKPSTSGETPVRGWLDALRRRFAPVAVTKAEVLPAEIGYLEIANFPAPELAAPEYAQALEKLKRTQTIIVDLRHTSGGSRESARLLASYFVDRPLPLSEVHYRDRVERPWTVAKLGAPPHLGEMYVLTSRETRAAAEDFAYTMQAMKRAEIVGEPTRGGASVAAAFPLGPHFVASIPQARLVSPITHANWEGVGVKPDMRVPAGEALRAIRRAILTDRLAHASNMLGYVELKKMLAEL